MVNFKESLVENIKRETRNDYVMNALSEIIHTGWPEKLQDLPTNLRDFWSYRDELAIYDGIIHKGQRVVIPHKLRQGILENLTQIR